MKKKIVVTVVFMLVISSIIIIIPSKNVLADSYDGEDLALAILANSSVLIDSAYTDKDQYHHRQAIVLEQLGTMLPTNGPTFALLSTGVAGASIVTTDEDEPGSERGEWFQGGSHGYPRDRATLTLTLQVPMFMHYLYYDVQFFSSEYPEYVGTQYNDKLTITVNSPTKGSSAYIFDVNSGYFLLDSSDIPNTGFDIFARSGYPGGVDNVDTIFRRYGADAGASGLIQIGGVKHPVSPNEQITITFEIKDEGDNQFDSAAYIDNLKFTGFSKTEISARKTVEDMFGQPIETAECEDTIKYKVIISNTGAALQRDNPGNEFEDTLPSNVTYIDESATATSGTINFDIDENKITWNGQIPGESSVILSFDAVINSGLNNGEIISNQGIVNWDSNEDRINDALELTDNPYIDDGVDQDNDNETDDDDPTNITIIRFETPPYVEENFSDDTIGEKANQSYSTRSWFETTKSSQVGTCFEVAGGYYYETPNSYKTKIRQSGGKSYWNYTLSELEGDIIWWEVCFACGDSFNSSDLYLDFKNDNNQNIARLKFEYVEIDEDYPMNWVLDLSYWDPIDEWVKLSSDFEDGHLRNSWYKLRIEKNGENNINYILNRSGIGNTDTLTGKTISTSFENLDRVEFYSTKDPIVCPMIFWDEHFVGLIPT